MEAKKNASSYSIKIDDAEDFSNICYYDGDIFYEEGFEGEGLFARLGRLPGVDEIDYNGHFGQRVWLTVEESYNTSKVWKEIFQTINDYIQEAREYYEKANQEEDEEAS